MHSRSVEGMNPKSVLFSPNSIEHEGVSGVKLHFYKYMEQIYGSYQTF